MLGVVPGIIGTLQASTGRGSSRGRECLRGAGSVGPAQRRAAQASLLHPATPAPPAPVHVRQALEAVKLLSGVGEPLSRRLLVTDLAAGRFHAVKLRAK